MNAYGRKAYKKARHKKAVRRWAVRVISRCCFKPEQLNLQPLIDALDELAKTIKEIKEEYMKQSREEDLEADSVRQQEVTESSL